MAYRVIWTLRALEDLELTTEYLSKDSPMFAASFVDQVLHAAATLTIYPNRGRYSPDLDDPEIREIFVKQHRLIYNVIGDRVNIIRLVHMARNKPEE